MGNRGWVQAAGLTGSASSRLDRGPLGPRRRLLIADDDPDTRALYAWALRAAGWFVTEAADGLEAIGMAASLRPHAIVIDLCMPGLGGADAVACLRRDDRTSKILIVGCSGLDRVGAEARALEAGCNAFVSKPCSPDELCVVLEELTCEARRSTVLLMDGASDSLAALALERAPARRRP